MQTKRILIALLALGTGHALRAEPLTTSWLTIEGARYARIYRTQADALAGISVTNWFTGGRIVAGAQTNPVYAGVQSIRISTNYVYVQSSAMAHHIMGPWYLDATKTNLFPNYPSRQDMLARFPRSPTTTVAKSRTSLGATALWVDGTIIHNQLDAFYWNVTNDANSVSVFTRSWQRNARYAEGLTFDPSGSHQPFTGERHHHISPSALRHQLGDHVDYNPTNHTYTESTTPPEHSPILGWSFDGHPIYGPYGFADATNLNSAVTRMRSGYVFRDGSYGTTNLNLTGRTSYPAWANAITPVPPFINGPNVSANYPLGWYVQDFDHLADHGYIQGTDFDLDRYNGRLCLTPEFPGGTYAYFVTIETNGAPAFPYIIGLQYYGVKNGGDYGNPASVGFTNVETNIVAYLGGPDAQPVLTAPTHNGTLLTLTWAAAEGGHYKIETTSDLTTWTNEIPDIRAAGTNAQTTADGTNAKKIIRVTRTSLDNYDPVITP